MYKRILIYIITQIPFNCVAIIISDASGILERHIGAPFRMGNSLPLELENTAPYPNRREKSSPSVAPKDSPSSVESASSSSGVTGVARQSSEIFRGKSPQP